MAIAPVTSIRPVARTDSPAKKGVGDGIGARQEQKAEEELDFFDKVSNFFTTFGGKALQQGKPEKPDNRTLHMEVYKEMDMQDEARRSAELLRQDRQGAGITRSLTSEEWAHRYSNEKAITPNTTAPFWHQGKEHNEALDVTPVEVTAVPTQSAPVGLMSPPTAGTPPAVDINEPPEPAAQNSSTSTTTFATIIKNGSSTIIDSTVPLTGGFDSLTLSEGTSIHLDGRGYVTLPHGIVPDANSIKNSEGTPFDPTGKHGLRAADLPNVDYTGATKYGISRLDYTSDEDWAKAVYAEFGNRTATSYGTGFADLTDSAKQAAYDMAWNAGVGSVSWDSVQTMLTEASKADEADKTTDNLIGFTTNFRSEDDYPRGLLKRRLQTYNLVAKEGEQAATITTTAVMTRGVRTATKYDIKNADGTILKSWTKPDTDEILGDLRVE
jgi:hypothetical protein